MQFAKKPGMMERIFGQKKDKLRTKSDPRLTAEAMNAIHVQPHAGTKVRLLMQSFGIIICHSVTLPFRSVPFSVNFAYYSLNLIL